MGQTLVQFLPVGTHCHKVNCDIYGEFPSLLPFPGDGERQASLSSEVASCRGKDLNVSISGLRRKERRHTGLA